MANNDALLQHIIVIQLIRADLVVHTQNGLGGNVRIIGSAAVFLSQISIHVFKIGQVDLNMAGQSVDCLCRFVSAAVVDDGNWQRLLQAFQYSLYIRRWGNQVYIVCTAADQLTVDFTQTGWANGDTGVTAADYAVLAEAAAQITPCKKYGAGTVLAADARLLPLVESRSGSDRLQGAVTVSRHRAIRRIGKAADDSALPGTVAAGCF